jgi:DnaA family protein
MNDQLVLGLQLRDSARFSNFVAGSNKELLGKLQQLATLASCGQLLCWGQPGTGKTHLLQAVCHQVTEENRTAAYLSLDDTTGLPAGLLEGWENHALVCLDNIQAIAGQADWEEAVFHLYNRLHDRQHSLVVSASLAPAQLPLALLDLRSRLGAGLVYQLESLNDQQSLEALQLRARLRGLELPDDTGRYLLKRMPRDLPALMELLEQLDAASLAAQRRLTIPFTKTVLGL